MSVDDEVDIKSMCDRLRSIGLMALADEIVTNMVFEEVEGLIITHFSRVFDKPCVERHMAVVVLRRIVPWLESVTGAMSGMFFEDTL